MRDHSTSPSKSNSQELPLLAVGSFATWTRGFTRKFSRTSPAPGWVTSEAFDPGFDEGDCNYHSICLGSDGRVYFTLSTHRIDRHARFCCFDPKKGAMVFVRDIGEALLEEDKGNLLPQGKIHVPLTEVGGRIYFATHIGYYKKDRQGREKYPGFHIMHYDMKSDNLANVIRGPEEEGLITGQLVEKSLTYYGLTWPSGLFCRYDIVKRELQVSSPPCPGRPNLRETKGGRELPICRALASDPEGNLYGACADGSVWRCEPASRPEFLPGVNVLQGTVEPIDKKGKANSCWREIFWNDQDHCFYGTHAGTQSLFQFDPYQKIVRPVARIGAAAFHKKGHAPHGSQLGIVMGLNSEIYHIVHGPPIQIKGRKTILRSAYLVSYNLKLRKFNDHGPIRLQSGERVIFTESLTTDPDGNIYAVSWVEAIDPKTFSHFKRLREVAANGECQGEIYKLMLLRISADEIQKGINH
jgi:hypothetical protein